MELVSFITTFFVSKKIWMLSAFVCWSPDEALSLWRRAASAGLRVRLYTLPGVPGHLPALPDLPAYDRHREGVLLDLACPTADAVLMKASRSRAFNHRLSWLVLQPALLAAAAAASTFGRAAILPDADVTWSAPDTAADVYRVKPNLPLLVTPVHLLRNMTLEQMESLWSTNPTAVARRKNLQNVYFTAVTVITQPQHFKGWSDLANRQIDTFPKMTYPLMMLLAEDLHFRYDLRQVDSYGEEVNGSFSGAAGLLQRGAAELGITSMFMRAPRYQVLHYCSETVELKGAFIFRQPARSAVSNIFVLPLSRGVWAAAGGAALLGAALLAAAARLPAPARHQPASAHHQLAPACHQLAPLDCLTFALAALCQQGFHVCPDGAAARLTMLSALVSSLFLFTAYSAKIVALLQSPSDAIQSIEQLAHSPLTLGVQETTYKKTFFAESVEPATQHLYRHKLLPQGERAYMSVVEGVARLRTGLFAFQVEQSAGYEIISKTFTEREKCGLQEVQAFKLPMVAVPLRRHSGLRDLLATRLRWQREVGLTSRWRQHWLAPRPRCDAGAGGMVGVGLADVWPALQVWAAGAALALALLAAELLLHARVTRARPSLRPADHSSQP